MNARLRSLVVSRRLCSDAIDLLQRHPLHFGRGGIASRELIRHCVIVARVAMKRGQLAGRREGSLPSRAAAGSPRSDARNVQTLHTPNRMLRVGRRLIFIGDIHGCIDEFRELLDRIAPTTNDVVVSLGDTVNKGPDPVGVVELIVRSGIRAIQGNKERELLAHMQNPARRLFAFDGERAMLHRPDLLSAMQQWPLWIDFPEEEVLAVHGGVLPIRDVTPAQLRLQSATLPMLRYVRRKDDRWVAIPKGKQNDADPFWTEVWTGVRTVVYGHTPRSAVKQTGDTIGLDTGCVYGGALSAAVWKKGEWKIVSVAARAAYAK